MAEPFTIYKVAILYMLNRSGFPLTNMKISSFFLERDYTDYFRVQEALGGLEDAGLIRSAFTRSNAQYSITDEGRATLDLQMDKMTAGIAEDVRKFLSDNEAALRQENSMRADYYKTTGPDYAVRLQLLSGKKRELDLTLLVRSKKQAEAVCANWKNQNEEVYMYLMDILLK